jgi:hypothetical protein
MNRVLVIGAPRSGTTWLAHALAATPGSRLANEPDNTAFNADAAESQELYGGYPAPHVGEHVPAYERLWDPVFNKPPFATVHLIAKSVQCAFSIEWLMDRHQPRVVLIQRHPVRVVSSWMRKGFIVGDLATRERIQADYVEPLNLPCWDPDAPELARVAWAVGVLMTVMQLKSRAHPQWTLVSHEWLCASPMPRLEELARSLGLQWLEETEARIHELGDTERILVEPDAAGVPLAWQAYPAEDGVAAMALLRRFPELEPWIDSTVSSHTPPSSTRPNLASGSAMRNSMMSSR